MVDIIHHYPFVALLRLALCKKGWPIPYIYKKHEPIQTNSSFEMLMVVTRDRVVAGLLTQKTNKVSHFEEELWIKISRWPTHIFPDWLGLGESSNLKQHVGTKRRPLQHVFWKTVGTLDEWNPTTKCQRGKFMLSSEATNLKWSHTHILFDLDRDSWKDWLIKSSKQKMQKKN